MDTQQPKAPSVSKGHRPPACPKLLSQALTFLLALLLSFASSASAAAQVEAHRLSDDAPRDGQWETLRVSVRHATDSLQVAVQDARGGPIFWRDLPVGDGATILLPLSFVAPNELPLGSWPVCVLLRHGDTIVQRTNLDLPTPPSTPPQAIPLSSPRACRLLALHNDPIDPVALRDWTSAPVILSRVSLAELLSDPPLAFASCDALWLNERILAQLSSRQAAALAACGLTFLYAHPTAPAGNLAHWLWVRPHNSSRLWVVPQEYQTIASPRVLEPALAQLHLPAVQPGRTFTILALLITPVAIGLVLLASLVIRRPAVLLATIGGLLVVWTAVAIAFLQAAQPDSPVPFAWTLRHAPGSVALHEEFSARQFLFRRRLEFSASQPVPPLPLAATGADWLSLDGVEVFFPSSGDPCRITIDLPSRQTLWLKSRDLSSAVPLGLEGLPPSSPAEGDRGAWLVEGGYIAAADHPAQRTIFPQWLAAQPPAARLVWQAWYTLRCKVDHRYRITPVTPTYLNIIDYGPSASGG